jgi:hypothetical protein
MGWRMGNGERREKGGGFGVVVFLVSQEGGPELAEIMRVQPDNNLFRPTQ